MDKIQCKNCGSDIQLDDSQLILCDYCNTVYRVRDIDSLPEPKEKRKRKRGEPDLTIFEHPNGLEIQYGWRTQRNWFFILFAGIWFACGLFFMWSPLAIGRPEMLIEGGYYSGDGGTSLDMAPGAICFLIPMIVIGAYFMFMFLLNKTTVMMGARELSILYGPIPSLFHRQLVIDRRSIEQAYCVQRVSYTQNESPVYCYDVRYKIKGGGDELLVKGFESIQQAAYVEQQIEHMYQIDDEAVSGEFKAGSER